VRTVQDVMCGDGAGCKKHAPLAVHIGSCWVLFSDSRGNGDAGELTCRPECVLWCYDRKSLTALQRRKRNHKDTACISLYYCQIIMKLSNLWGRSIRYGSHLME